MASTSSVFKLAPGIQDYAWGKKGASSLAAEFAKVSVKNFQIKDDKTYAEVRFAVPLHTLSRMTLSLTSPSPIQLTVDEAKTESSV